MRTYRTGRGPFAERPYFESEELERLCTEELRKVNLYPDNPEQIRIDRFVEKRFGISPEYDELPQGVLGFTKFGPKGVERVVVARDLAEASGKVSERRINTTLAHEAGHGLLHAHLFVVQETAMSMFGADYDPKSPKIMCRDVITPSYQKLAVYDGRWWEFQANQTIGALLLPRELVGKCVAPLLTGSGSFGLRLLKKENTKKAVDLLAETFNVNPAVAQIRIQQLYPEKDSGQLTL
jgi:hypothetical protein